MHCYGTSKDNLSKYQDVLSLVISSVNGSRLTPVKNLLDFFFKRKFDGD